MSSRKRTVPTEAEEQSAVISYCAFRHIPVFHIPNGGSRNVAEARHLKAQGVKPGVPDLFIPVPGSRYAGLFVEMKAQKGRVSEYQKAWLNLLNRNGYRAVVCYGFDEARKILDDYFTDPAAKSRIHKEDHL